MPQEISRADAESRLANAISNFDWAKEFLGDKNGLLDNYRALHAQLREGDRLSIEVDSTTYYGRYGVEVKYPVFNIALYKKGQAGKEVVYSFSDDVNMGRRLLYQDQLSQKVL